MSKRVLHVVTTINRGGAENHLMSLAAGQAATGWDVTVAYLKGDGYWRASMERHAVAVTHLDWRGYTDFDVVRRCADVMEETRPDVVHAHLPAAEIIARLAVRRFGQRIPLVVTKHSDDPLLGSPHFWMAGFWAERAAARVIAISNAVGRYLRTQHLLPTTKISVIHYGLDAAPYHRVTSDAIRKLRDDWGLSRQHVVIGTVCRLERQKRLDVLMRAFAAAQANQPNLRLVVVGAGSQQTPLQKFARELGIHDLVVWAGHRTDIPTVMCSLDAFALCSDYEGFGLVLLEAMAAAKPVIATRVSAIPEIVEDGITGLLCARGSHAEVASAIISLLNPERRVALGMAGAKRLESQFTVAKMVSSTVAVYGDILAAQPA